MTKFSQERKEAVIRKMCAPGNQKLSELSIEEGIALPTLYSWRKEEQLWAA